MIRNNKLDVSDFKPGKIQTDSYDPTAYYGAYFWTHRKPYFTLRWVRYMMDDSRVRYGLWLIKGPLIANMKVNIRCENPAAAEFIRENVDRFWSASAMKALRAIEYGYSGSEVVYVWKQGLIHFESLKVVQPFDARVLTAKSRIVGMVARRAQHRGQSPVYLWGPKAFWHVHIREEHPWYGISRLKFAYPYWFDKVRTSGSLDSLSLFFYKYAVSGSRVYFPTNTREDENGQVVNPKDQADRLANGIRSGGTMVIPNERDRDGNRLWEIEEASTPATGKELMDYQALLNTYMFEALGIPTEVIEAGASGSGYAGRRVPAQSFYAMLQELANNLLWDFDQQILSRLMWKNFPGIDYQVTSQSLIGEEQQQDGEEGGEEGDIGAQRGGGLCTATLRRQEGSAVTAPRENPGQ